jgi:hypothetical protein
MINLKFTATAEDGKDMTEELTNFANFIGLESVASGRYSFLLLLALFALYKSSRLNPMNVVREIQALEGFGKSSVLKPPSLFKRQPLKGLWHKHYRENGLAAMAINLNKALKNEKKYGIHLFKQRIQEAQQAGEERYITEEDWRLLAIDAVNGNWKRLINNQALTGEWIIYAQHEGVNYYLCLGKHDSGDDRLREQIDAVCCQEFPFLTNLLANA